MRKSLALMTFACAVLAGCGDGERGGGLTAEEERQLDEAARMLEDNMIDVSPDSLVANDAEMQAIEANDTGLGQSPPGNGQ